MIARRRAHVLEDEWPLIEQHHESTDLASPSLVGTWERTVAEYVGMPHAAAVSSGRRGMTLIFQHLGVGEGDEVIVPAYTLGDLIPLVQAIGATPVPADIDPNTFNLDPEAVAKRITPKTKAILALHVFGNACEIEAILDLGEKHGIPVIEDGAHALGARMGDRPLGSFGYASFFSFENTKPVNTWGGGMVLSHDAALVQRVRDENAGGNLDLTSVVGKTKAYRTERKLFDTGLAFLPLYCLATPSLAALMNRLYRSAQYVPPGNLCYAPFQAKLALEKFDGMDERIRRRNELADRYRSLLTPKVRPQEIRSGTLATQYFFTVALPCAALPVRKKLLWRRVDAGIGAEVADDTAAMLGMTDCPNVAALTPRLIALPMHDYLTEAEVDHVAKALNRIVG